MKTYPTKNGRVLFDDDYSESAGYYLYLDPEAVGKEAVVNRTEEVCSLASGCLIVLDFDEHNLLIGIEIVPSGLKT